MRHPRAFGSGFSVVVPLLWGERKLLWAIKVAHLYSEQARADNVGPGSVPTTYPAEPGHFDRGNWTTAPAARRRKLRRQAGRNGR